MTPREQIYEMRLKIVGGSNEDYALRELDSLLSEAYENSKADIRLEEYFKRQVAWREKMKQAGY